MEPLYFVLCEGVGCATAEISECDKGVRWEVSHILQSPCFDFIFVVMNLKC